MDKLKYRSACPRVFPISVVCVSLATFARQRALRETRRRVEGRARERREGVFRLTALGKRALDEAKRSRRCTAGHDVSLNVEEFGFAEHGVNLAVCQLASDRRTGCRLTELSWNTELVSAVVRMTNWRSDWTGLARLIRASRITSRKERRGWWRTTKETSEEM